MKPKTTKKPIVKKAKPVEPYEEIDFESCGRIFHATNYLSWLFQTRGNMNEVEFAIACIVAARFAVNNELDFYVANASASGWSTWGKSRPLNRKEWIASGGDVARRATEKGKKP